MVENRTLTVHRLCNSGFTEMSSWSLSGENLLTTPENLPAQPGVYAFAIDEVVQYVGLASVSIRQRFGFYARPGATQSTNIRLNAAIVRLIGLGRNVRVLVAHPPDSEWNGLRVSGPEGLEAALIKDFDLSWNRRGSQPNPNLSDDESLITEKQGNIVVGNGRPSGSGAVRSAIIAYVNAHVGVTEREIAQAIFGRAGVQQQVNPHCRELVRTGHLVRLPTTPLTYKIGHAR